MQREMEAEAIRPRNVPARLLVTIIARLRPSRANARPPPPSRNSIGGYRSGVSLDQTPFTLPNSRSWTLESRSCRRPSFYWLGLPVCLLVVGRLVVSDVGINCVPERTFSLLSRKRRRARVREREREVTAPSPSPRWEFSAPARGRAALLVTT